MSVPTDKRRKSGAEFEDNALRLQLKTREITNKMPKSQRFTDAIPLYDLSREIYNHVEGGNQIEVKTAKDYEQRRGHFMEALALCASLGAQVTVAEEVLGISEDTAFEWGALIGREINLLTGIIESEYKKFSYLLRQESKAERQSAERFYSRVGEECRKHGIKIFVDGKPFTQEEQK